MEQKKEAVYLINDERYLHLRENGAGVGFATYNKVTGEPLESGQISEKNLPPDGRNAISAARNWYLFELSWLWETLVIVLAAAAVCVVCAMLICKAVKKNFSKKTAAVIGAAAFAGAVLAVIVIARTPMPL